MSVQVHDMDRGMHTDMQRSIHSPSVSNERAVNDKGVHLIGDMYNVRGGSKEMSDKDSLELFCLQKVKEAGLESVGKIFYQFPESGVTGVVLLAESHIAIHTWPEKDYVTLDIYVCNVSQNNTEKAKRLYDSIIELFQPENISSHSIDRE